jgi:ribosome-associated translation inhibitor RaiA
VHVRDTRLHRHWSILPHAREELGDLQAEAKKIHLSTLFTLVPGAGVAGTRLPGEVRTAMTIVPEIIFHEVGRREWVETYVGERLQRLHRFAEGITRCRVTLTREQRSQRTANLYSVLIEVRLPPQHDLAVKKQKEIRDMSTQLPALINLAFGAIERQLKKTAALRRGEEKAHDGQPQGMGEVQPGR